MHAVNAFIFEDEAPLCTVISYVGALYIQMTLTRGDDFQDLSRSCLEVSQSRKLLCDAVPKWIAAGHTYCMHTLGAFLNQRLVLQAHAGYSSHGSRSLQSHYLDLVTSFSSLCAQIIIAFDSLNSWMLSHGKVQLLLHTQGHYEASD